MIFERGTGRIAGPYEVDSTGQQYVLPGPTQYLKIAINGSAKMYLTQQDYNSDVNYWTLHGDDSSTEAFSAPVSVSSVWLRATATAEVTFFVGTTV